MYVTPEQIQAANKTTLETALSVATTQFAAFEKLATLGATTAKSIFEESIANTKALIGAKDVQEYVALQNTFAAPAIEKALGLSKSVYAVATEAGTELSKVAEKQVSDWNESFTSMLDKVSKNSPPGSDFAFSAVKTALAAANSAYDNMSKVAKQAGEIADANIAAAVATTKTFAKPKKVA